MIANLMRQNLYLHPKQILALKKLSAEMEISISEVVRSAIDSYLGRQAHGSDDEMAPAAPPAAPMPIAAVAAEPTAAPLTPSPVEPGSSVPVSYTPVSEAAVPQDEIHPWDSLSVHSRKQIAFDTFPNATMREINAIVALPWDYLSRVQRAVLEHMNWAQYRQ